jgi:threonine dehydratase
VTQEALTLPDIEEARTRIAGRIYKSPCAYSETFSRRSSTKAHFKLENLQMTGSFKERGALNKIFQLTNEEKKRGVIAASTGNHAQAVAYIAQQQGISATIVMPRRTPLVKIANTRSWGARVILEGQSFDEAYEKARLLQREDGSTFVHPFDDAQIVAGQGTLGLELLEQVPDLEVVILPIGGGGLISGVGLALKTLRPRIKIIGVQTAAVPSMKKSVEAGTPVTLPPRDTIADGIAVKRPGELTLRYVERYVDEIVTVDEEEIASAILLLLEQEKTVAEGAGACTLAALSNGYVPAAHDRSTAIVLSGGNIDVNVLSRIIDRGLAKDGRLVQWELYIHDEPGALANLLLKVGECQANVIEIHHNRAFNQLGLAEVQVQLTLETRGGKHAAEVRAALEAAGYLVS